MTTNSKRMKYWTL